MTKVVSMSEYKIEKTALEMIKNFGIPDSYRCGSCGKELSQEELIRHLKANPKGECGDA